MEKDIGTDKGRGKAKREIDSEGLASVKSPERAIDTNPTKGEPREGGYKSASSVPAARGGGFTGMTPEEARRKAKETDARLMAKLRVTKPARTLKLLEAIPPAYKSRAVRVLAGVASHKARIRANCEQCVGWEEVGKRVGSCTVFSCMFWDVRPYQSSKDEVSASEVADNGGY